MICRGLRSWPLRGANFWHFSMVLDEGLCIAWLPQGLLCSLQQGHPRTLVTSRFRACMERGSTLKGIGVHQVFAPGHPIQKPLRAMMMHFYSFLLFWPLLTRWCEDALNESAYVLSFFLGRDLWDINQWGHQHSSDMEGHFVAKAGSAARHERGMTRIGSLENPVRNLPCYTNLQCLTM